MSEETLLAQMAALRAEIEDLRASVDGFGSDDSGPQGSRGLAPDWFDAADGGGLDISKVALGYKINPAGDDPDLVRIYAGEKDRIAVAQTDVTVANNGYVYLRQTIADNTMLVTTAASVPANDATYNYYRLYRFAVTAGAASILSIYRPFDIETGSGGASDEITIVTDVRYDATTKQLQKKTRLVIVTFKSGASESGWTLISGGQAEECP